MSRPRLSLLGGFALRDGQGKAVDLPLRKARALLAFLAAEGDRRHSRDRLAGLLWGTRGEEQARRSLTKCLTQLRRALGGPDGAVLQSDKQEVWLEAGGLSSDLEHLRRLAGGRICARDSSENGLLALCEAGLLDDFALDEAAFDAWLAVERAAVQRMQLTLLEDFAEAKSDGGEQEAAVSAAERMLRLDPLGEAGHRLLMRAYGRAGQRSAALAQYKVCAELLQRELDVAPESATLQLYEELQAGDGALAPVVGEGKQEKAETSSALPPTSSLSPASSLPRTSSLPSVAILAFTNMSDEADQEHLADGLTEDIITGLSRFSSLAVTARHSSFSFKGRQVTAQQVGQELGVDYVLEGSIRRSGELLRVNAQLIDAANDQHLWAERYDRNVSEFFQMEDELVQKIAITIWHRLEGVGLGKLRAKPGGDMTAYDLTMRGRAHFKRFTKEENAKARRDFERALEQAPGSAWSTTNLAWTYHWEGMSSWSADPEESLQTGLALARQAVELDPSDAAARTALACAGVFTRHYERAADDFEKALALNPNDPETMALMAYLYNNLGQPEEGLLWIEKAIRYNPFAPNWFHWELAVNRYVARDYRAAIATLSKMEVTPFEVLGLLAASHAWLGEDEEAALAMARFHREARQRMAHYPEGDAAAWRAFWSIGFPFKERADMDHLLEGLRLAGLPIDEDGDVTELVALPPQDTEDRETAPAPNTGKPAVAVLAFNNRSGAGDHDYLAEGLSEDLVTELARFHSLSVVGRQAELPRDAQARSAKEIGQALGVDFILEGSLARDREQIRVTAQLIDSESGQHLWAERYDRKMTDLFTLRDELVQTIVSTIAPRLEGIGLAQAQRKGTANLTAYELVLRGRAHYDRMTCDDDRAAIESFERAIALDPTYSAAYAHLARAHVDGFLFGWSADPDEALGRALSAARQAVQLDESDALAHAVLASVFLYARQHGQAEQEMAKAVALNPHIADVQVLMGFLLEALGRWEEALSWVEKAVARNPLAPDWYSWEEARAYFLGRRYREVIAIKSKMAATPYEIHGLAAASHAWLGERAAAAAALKQFHAGARNEIAGYTDSDTAAWRRYWSNSFPFRDQEHLAHLFEGLRRAGLAI